jgi:hypothetical protein
MRIGLIAPILASVCAVAEGAVQGNFYPLQGRLASQTPPAVFSASFKGDLINPESLSAALASSEALKGKWISVTTGKRRFQDPPVPPPSRN